MFASIRRWFARSHSAAMRGHVDFADSAIIRGWAWDPAAPSSRLTLDVFCRGIFLGCARTGTFRQDLFDQGIGDGCCGFTFHIPPAAAHAISTRDIEVFATNPAPVVLMAAGEARSDSTAHGPSDVRSFFLPMIRQLNASTPMVPAPTEDGMRRQIARLCASRGQGAASAFEVHIAEKYGRPVPTENLESFDTWYLETYGLEKGPARPPLTASHIDRHARAHRNRIATRADRYAWAIHGSRRLFVEDCLVEPHVRDDLRALPLPGRGGSFPLSRFMVAFKARHHLLRHRPARTVHDRIAIYAVLMLFALRDAHYLGYLPVVWLEEMLETGSNRFEDAQTVLFGVGAPIVSRETFVNLVARSGYDSLTKTFAPHRYGAHRVLHAGALVGGPAVDVQMIGPFKRKLGLAESARRIAIALDGGRRSLNFVDYDIGCSPHAVAPDLVVGGVRAARINIVHLNAEEVPEAMAFLPDTFSQSHTILIPYWELDRPSEVHRLGLDLVDEVWTTSDFLTSVFEGQKPVTHIGMSFDDRPLVSKGAGRVLLAKLGIAVRRFTFITIADALSWTRRKNVLGTIEAFQAAFPGEAEVAMIVKIRNVDAALSPAQSADWAAIVAICKADPRITIIDVDLSAFDQKALLAGADCLVSLHRAEGLGLDILDALHRGTPVVATAYSGNMDVCNDDTCWLVDYDLIPVGRDDYAFVEPGQVWAEPKVASAVAALRDVRRDGARREARAATAQAYVRAVAAPSRMTAHLADLLDERLGVPREVSPSPARSSRDRQRVSESTAGFRSG